MSSERKGTGSGSHSPFHISRGVGGYTLIELLVVVALIGILVMISYVSLNNANQHEQTRSTALNIRTELQSDREQSLANKIASFGSSVGLPASYYGILLYGRVVGGSTYVATSYAVIRVESESGLDCSKADCGATVLSRESLPSNITVTSSGTVGLTAVRVIAFHASTAAVGVFDTNGNLISPAPGTVTLTVAGSGNNQTVDIDTATGRIQ